MVRCRYNRTDFAAFLKPEETALRVNTLRNTAAEAAECLHGSVSALCGGCVKTASFDGVLEGVEAGDWFVQDEASALCAHILGHALERQLRMFVLLPAEKVLRLLWIWRIPVRFMRLIYMQTSCR